MELFALMWAWFIGLLGKTPKTPKDGTFTRVGYKRRGFNVWVVDLQSKERFCVRAESVPEAKQFTSALTFGALQMPEAPAHDVADAAMQVVARSRKEAGRA